MYIPFALGSSGRVFSVHVNVSFSTKNAVIKLNIFGILPSI